MSPTPAGLAAFDEMVDDEARRLMLTCLDVPRWADEVVAGRPYAHLGEIEDAMVAASATITGEPSGLPVLVTLSRRVLASSAFLQVSQSSSGPWS